MSQFQCSITSPFFSSNTTDPNFYPASILATGFQGTGTKVSIPRSNMRTAETTVSMYDPLWEDVNKNWNPNALQAYVMFLYVRYRGRVVFWGPITTPEIDSEAGTVKMSAFDHGIRLQHHYLRRGDGNIHGEKGTLTLDYRGIRACRDAGNNVANQDVYGAPPLGIKNGVNTATAHAQHFIVHRGDECWQTALDISNNTLGPDFELEPQDLDPQDPYYYKLNTWDFQGENKSSVIRFEDGYGLRNVKKSLWTPGGKIITHAHVLDDKGYRVTSADEQSAGLRGVWVFWDALNQTVPHNATGEAALRAVGDQLVRAYSKPPNFVKVDLKMQGELPINSEEYHYKENFDVGDIVLWGMKKGAFKPETFVRINEVNLEQADKSGNVRESVSVVPWIDMTSFDDEDS